jgi:hypothetical protein
VSAFGTLLSIASVMSVLPLQVIPNTKMELEEWEHVTCLKNVSLAYEGTRSGLKGYIAVGTNYNYGEDITSRGRVRTCDILAQNFQHKVILNFIHRFMSSHRLLFLCITQHHM